MRINEDDKDKIFNLHIKHSLRLFLVLMKPGNWFLRHLFETQKSHIEICIINDFISNTHDNPLCTYIYYITSYLLASGVQNSFALKLLKSLFPFADAES